MKIHVFLILGQNPRKPSMNNGTGEVKLRLPIHATIRESSTVSGIIPKLAKWRTHNYSNVCYAQCPAPGSRVSDSSDRNNLSAANDTIHRIHQTWRAYFLLSHFSCSIIKNRRQLLNHADSLLSQQLNWIAYVLSKKCLVSNASILQWNLIWIGHDYN